MSGFKRLSLPKLKEGDTVKRKRRFSATPKGELEITHRRWETKLPIFGPGTNRWFYKCRSKENESVIDVHEKYLQKV